MNAPSDPPPLPSVTVSFLLTDIEGSTALWERAGEEFRAALVAHQAVTRRVLAECGGRELTEAGDGFLVVFEEAAAAARCAVALQEALARTPWPAAVGAVQVRMALHAGPVEPLANGEFRGPTLNRAARLRDGAHGGQIVASEPVVQAVASAWEVVDLGMFRLRGLSAPERVSQLCWPGMPRREFPAPLLAPAYQANLPVAQTRFFGRAPEISRLRQMLGPAAPGAARLVTLTGPGGTGKTRLSLAVGESLLGEFSHAVWFVPLADLDAVDQVPAALREALRLPPDPARDALAQVLELLASQPGLLILDNFEQLAPEGAGLVQTLLARAPALRCLVTSRQRLGLAGEREFTLHPLAVPGAETGEEFAACESVQLFVDRAQAVRSDFALTPGNVPAVGELCRQLDGVPLALELAAARAQVVTPQEMVRQLGQRLDYFASHDPQTPARQRTLRAAIDWSYDFLPPALQEFFANLAVFRGGWVAEAAVAVAAVPGLGGRAANVLHALGELRACSLLLATEDGETMRFHLLETLRQYAGERLAASPHEQAVRQRHVAFYYQFADQAQAGQIGAGQLEWLDRVEAEQDNLLAAIACASGTPEALQIAADLVNFWATRGFIAEGRTILAKLLAVTPDPSPKLLGCAHSAGGILALHAADYPAAHEHFTQALQIFRDLEEARNVAGMWNNLGTVALRRKDYPACQAAFREALAIYDTLQMEWQRNQLLGNLCGAAVEQRDPQAQVWAEECLRTARRLGDRVSAAKALHNLGNVARHEGRGEDAWQHFSEALEIQQIVRDQINAAESFCTLGCAGVATGRLEEGVRWLAATEIAVQAFKTELLADDAEDAARALEQARRVLCPERLAELWREGQILGEEKVRIFLLRF